MKKIVFTLLFLSQNLIADPFWGEQEKVAQNALPQEENQTEFAKNPENITACKPSEQRFSLNLPTEFEKLKLVGIVKINGVFRALFLDEQNQLFDIAEKELLNRHEIEILNINLKSITYINWKLTTDCNSPYQTILKL